MDKTPNRHELLDLLDALCHDRLDPARHERLQQFLKDDPDAQRVYLDYLDTHLALRKLLRGTDRERDVASGPSRTGLGSPPARWERWARFGPRLAFAAVAATLLAFTVPFLLRRDRPDGDGQGRDGNKPPAVLTVATSDPTPRLIQCSGARFFGMRLPPTGSRLPFGEEFVLTDGFVELGFADGATAILRAPAVFEVADRARLVVKTGRCSVHAPDGAQGFRLETPVGEVVDLGTRFSVDVSDTGEAEVQVVEGLTEVYAGSNPRTRSQPVRLTTGQAQKYSLEGKVRANDVRFDRSKYISQLPDRIVTYEATEHEGGGAEALRSVSVQRDGVLRTYRVEELVGIDLIHYKSEPKGSIATGMDKLDPERGEPGSRRRLALLDRDALLTTGVINPGKATVPLTTDPVIHDPEDPSRPNTPGFAVRFHKPVVNSAGPDVVLFDVQMIIDREKGDPFYVSPLPFRPGLRTHLVLDYDIDLLSPEARTLADVRVYPFTTGVRTLSDLVEGEHNAGRKTSVRTKATAVGIDLSDLGYRPGESAEALFFQSVPTDRHPNAVVDPMFLAGLPPAEPSITRRSAHDPG